MEKFSLICLAAKSQDMPLTDEELEFLNERFQHYLGQTPNSKKKNSNK